MRVVIPILFTISAACGSLDPGGEPLLDAQDVSEHLEPLAVGSVWTYLIADPDGGPPVIRHTTVEAYEDIGAAHAGTLAFRLRAGKLGGETVSWEGYAGEQAVRFAQSAFDTDGNLTVSLSLDPYRLKVDQSAAHMTDGAAFSETYVETSSRGHTVTRTMNWTVIAASEPLTVPAGSYSSLHVQRVDPATGKSKDYWFVEGVGKVKEAGGDEDKELVSFTP